MATGAFLASRSKNELVAANIERERHEIALHPQEEQTELSLFYQLKASCMSNFLLARQPIQDHKQSVETLMSCCTAAAGTRLSCWIRSATSGRPRGRRTTRCVASAATSRHRRGSGPRAIAAASRIATAPVVNMNGIIGTIAPRLVETPAVIADCVGSLLSPEQPNSELFGCERAQHRFGLLGEPLGHRVGGRLVDPF